MICPYKKSLRLLLLLMLFTIMLIPFLYGFQEGVGSGRILGTVKDEEGKPIPGAKVVAEFLKTGRIFTATSDSQGKWAMAGLGTGMFRITATKEGYPPVFLDRNVSQFKNDPIHLAMPKIPEIPPEAQGAEGMELFAEGNRLYEEEKYAEALLKYHEFLEKNPAMDQVRVNIANCYREMGEHEKALVEYNALLEKIEAEKGSLQGDRTAAQILASIGESFLKQQDFAGAAEYFEKSFSLLPEDEATAFNIAQIYFNRGESGKAIEYYKKAIQIKQDWPRPYRELGYAYLNTGEYKLAVEALSKFLELDPENPEAPNIRNLIPSIEKLIKK